MRAAFACFILMLVTTGAGCAGGGNMPKSQSGAEADPVFEVEAMSKMPGDTRMIMISGRTGAPVGQSVAAILTSPDGEHFEVSAYKEFVPKEEGDTREAFMISSAPAGLEVGWQFALRDPP